MVNTVPEATETAVKYLYPFASRKPTSGSRQGDIWWVEVDIGLFEPKIIQFEIDARTGAIVRAR